MNSSVLVPYWWVDVIAIAVLILEALLQRSQPWARAAIGVYLTIAVWYLVDYAYSSDADLAYFNTEVIDTAFLQVLGFLLCYRLMLFIACTKLGLNRDDSEAEVEFSSKTLQAALWGMFFPWIILLILGFQRADWEVLGIIWPPSAALKVGMFSHSGIGGSSGFIVAFAGYIYLALCAFFGVGLALSQGGVRMAFLTLVMFSWPYFLFDRMRNQMLALMMPGILCYILIRRAPALRKLLVLCVLGWAINAWFLFAVRARGAEGGVVGEFTRLTRKAKPGESGLSGLSAVSSEHHYGLDMFKELCYSNLLIESGKYKINYGERYLSEIVNVIPRAIWKDKPMIGFDYAIARGFASKKADVALNATIATGMIGQGLVNFGPVFGVVSSAALMTAWSLILTQLWTQRRQIWRAMLFVLGLGLTFNLGRDITLLVLWPFVFAYGGVWSWEKWFGSSDSYSEHLTAHNLNRRLQHEPPRRGSKVPRRYGR